MSSIKPLKQRDEKTFEGRIIIAFNGKTIKEIAIMIDENPSSFWNWAKERTDMPKHILAKLAKHTDYLLNWILTGEGEKKLKSSASFDEILENKIRKVVKEETEKNEIDIRGLIREEILKNFNRLQIPSSEEILFSTLDGNYEPFGLIRLPLEDTGQAEQETKPEGPFYAELPVRYVVKDNKPKQKNKNEEQKPTLR